MRNSGRKLELDPVDDLFSTEESRQDAKREKVVELPLSELYPFPEHPFQVRDDDVEMTETVRSIQEYGVLTPVLVRPREDGGYEIMAGHRRKRACELAGLKTIPAIVRKLDRDMAIILMVDSNLQRENILPSERAKAYKMKLEAVKRQGERRSDSAHRSRETLSETESGRSIQRYIRLTELQPQLLQMVDEKKLAITPAVELSYLSPEEQIQLAKIMESKQITPSLPQAKELRNRSQENHLDEESILEILTDRRKAERSGVTLSSSDLRKYFPRNYTKKQMEETIFKLLESWQRKRQCEQER